MINLSNNPVQNELAELEQQLAGPVRGLLFMEREPDAAGVFSRSLVSRNVVSKGVLSGRILPRWVGYAAVVTVAIVLTITYSQLETTLLRSNPLEQKTYVTQAGQRATLTLRDGSRVILGPATTLRISQPESATEPTLVDISGEALFTVVHANYRPYTIVAHGVTTRVLGTEFVVRAYDPLHVRVAVRTGRVSVQSSAVTAENAVTIGAREAASVSSDGIPQVETIRDIATDFAWAEGNLVLRNVPLGEALTRLSRWYGLKFRVANVELLTLNIEAAFTTTYTRAQIQDLADAMGARVTQSGTVITFSAVP